MLALNILITVLSVFLFSCIKEATPTQSTQQAVPPLWSWQFDSISTGCGNFIAYSFTNSYKAAISVEANACSLSLSQNIRQFNLSNNDPNFQVLVRVFDKDPRSKTGYYCNDAMEIDTFPPVLLETWHAISGKVSISSDTIPQCPSRLLIPYQVNIVIDSLILKKDGCSLKVFNPKFEFKNVHVGWLVG